MKTKWHFSAHPIGIGCLLAAVLFVPIAQLAAALLAILIHEAAHLLTICLCRVKRCSVEWTPLGFVAQADGFSNLRPSRRIVIAASGLVASAGMALMAYPWANHERFGYLLFAANLALLLINALPLLPLDGSRILLALAAYVGKEPAAKKVLLFLSYLMAVLLTGLGLYGAFLGLLNPSLLILGPYLAYAARQSVLIGGIEDIQMLEERTKRQCGQLYKTEQWIAVGEANRHSLIKVLRQCPQEKFAIIHTIDPDTGGLLGAETEQQTIVKLLDLAGNGS